MLPLFLLLFLTDPVDAGLGNASDRCERGSEIVRQRVLATRLDDRSWSTFRAVAQARLVRNLDPFPDWFLCPDPIAATRELESDRKTRAALRRAGLSAEQYLTIGWAVGVAQFVEEFALEPDPRLEHNRDFVRRRKKDIDALGR